MYKFTRPRFYHLYWLFLVLSLYLSQNLNAEQQVSEFPKSLKIDGYKLVRVNSGKFSMGAPDLPSRAESYEGLKEVCIDKTFYLGETEVTQSFWEKYMQINPSRFQSPSLPVEGITWKEAMGFCSTLNKSKEKWSLPNEMIFRLPSEAEWEFAARAGSNSTFSSVKVLNILPIMLGFQIIQRAQPSQLVYFNPTTGDF